MENNTVTSELVATLAPVDDEGTKVSFTQPTDTAQLHDFNEFQRAEELVEEPAKPITSPKGRMAQLLTTAAGAMAASTDGAALWDTFTKLGIGGSMKVVKSKNWGGALSPERKAAIVEHNACISENAPNQALRERKQQKAQAKQILGCKPNKAQKKQLRKARTQAALESQGSQFGTSATVVAEQLVDVVDINHHLTDISEYDKPQAFEPQPYQAELLDNTESTETLCFGNKAEVVPEASVETQIDVTRTNIGNVVTALEGGAPTHSVPGDVTR